MFLSFCLGKRVLGAALFSNAVGQCSKLRRRAREGVRGSKTAEVCKEEDSENKDSKWWENPDQRNRES